MEWLTALLTWFAADPQAIDVERPKAAAAVQVAYCSMAKEIKDDAAEDTDAQAELEKPGGGRAAEVRPDASDSSGAGILRQEAPTVEAGCADGSCVAMPGVRSRLLRSR